MATQLSSRLLHSSRLVRRPILTAGSHRGCRVEALLGGVSRDIRHILDGLLGAGREVSAADAEILFQATGADLTAVVAAADEVRRGSVGGEVTYVVNRNINFTNVCVKRCGFCAFSRTGVDHEGYYLPMEEILRRALEAESMGASEVCIQAGLPPNMDGNLYADICRAIKSRHPNLHIHAFSPEEVLWGASRSRMSVPDFLRELQAAGVDSLPGTSAEILDDSLRKSVAKGRLSVAQWVEVVTTAHSLGLPTTATMMFGFCEGPGHLARHLVLLRDLQKKAELGGRAKFTEFVPLGFVAAEAPMWKKAGALTVRSGPSGAEVLRAHAVARLVLHPDLPGGIRNLQVSWVKEGLKMAQLLLCAGANDLGGTLMNESISTAAGSKHGQLAKPSELRRLVWELGPDRWISERGTTYGIRQRFPNPDSPAWEAMAAAEAACQESLAPSDSEHDALEQIADSKATFGSFHDLIQADKFRFKKAMGAARTPRAPADGWRAPGGLGQCRSASTLCKRCTPLTDSRCQFPIDSPKQRRASIGNLHLLSMRGVYSNTEKDNARKGQQRGLQSLRHYANENLSTAGGRTVTYSPSCTLVPTYECFNVCTYCNFRTNVTREGRDWLSDEEAARQLQTLKEKSLSQHTGEVVEILVMSGEVHPKAANRNAWLARTESICSIALDMGFLPHTNIGPLDRAEMQRLSAVNASMGLMLEQVAPSLQGPGGVHRFAPSKDPELRLAQLRQAGELGIPFTTGILIGIGETPAERLQALEAIAQAAEDFGHVQEVILQPHSLGSSQKLRPSSNQRDVLFGAEAIAALPGLVRAARDMLPSSVEIQVPPNLLLDSWEVLLSCLEAGARDLGGISPKDEVNPDFGFPLISVLSGALAKEGYSLQPRLPVYPQHFGWLPTRVQHVLQQRLERPELGRHGTGLETNPSLGSAHLKA